MAAFVHYFSGGYFPHASVAAPRGAAVQVRPSEPPSKSDSRNASIVKKAEAAKGDHAGTSPRTQGGSNSQLDAAKSDLAQAMASVVAAARSMKIGGNSGQPRLDAQNFSAAIMQQISADARVDEGVRDAIAKLESSGQDTPLARRQAAAEVLQANGESADDDEYVNVVLARASSPPPPAVSPAAYAQAAQEIAAVHMPDPQVRAEILKHADEQPAPLGPPPRGARELYQQNREVFDRALKDYGVPPWIISSIICTESGCGKNTGDHPVIPIFETYAKEAASPSRAKQAGRDLAALTRLSAQGDLGGLSPAVVRGSYAGAIGVPQFLPSSWEAYSRSASGGARNPWGIPDAILSVANFLKCNGYAKSEAGAVYSYNHSQKYVDQVLGLSAQIKASLH
jgi:membrane-bound lytic murein transglycosylase B